MSFSPTQDRSIPQPILPPRLNSNQVSVMVSTIENEFDAACTGVVLVDRSRIGRINVEGNDALDLLHRLSTNNLNAGRPGQVVGSVFTTDKGRIVDYVQVLVKESSHLLLTSPGNETEFVRWVEKYTIMEDVRLSPRTSSTAMFSLIGPKALKFVETILGAAPAQNTHATKALPIGNVTFSYRNEFQTSCIDIIAAADAVGDLVEYLLAAGVAFGLERMGESAYEAFRISRGIPTIKAELSESYNPYEAGLLHAIDFSKGCYLGQEIIARLDTYQKVQRQKWGIGCDPSMHPFVAGSPVFLKGEEIGHITSASNDIIHGKRLAIAILKKTVVKADDNVSIISGDHNVEGTVREFPIGCKPFVNKEMS